MTKYQQFCSKVLEAVDENRTEAEIRWQVRFIQNVQSCFSVGDDLPPGYEELQQLTFEAYREVSGDQRMVTSTGLKVLVEFLEFKAEATKLRLAGYVKSAGIYEKHAEERFRALPEELRW